MTLLLALIGCGGPEGDPPGGVPSAPPVPGDPGTKTVHRLNRTEYDNTVAHLFATRLRPGALLFPEDPVSYGFDNQADALTLTPVQAELYERAADLLIDDLFRVRAEESTALALAYDDPGVVPINGELTDAAYVFRRAGSLQATFPVGDDGTYRLRAYAYGTRQGDVAPRMALEVDGRPVVEVEVGTDPTGSHEVEVWLPPGDVTFAVRFVNPTVDPAIVDDRRALNVRRLELEGPLDPETGVREGYWEVVPCDPAQIGDTACATHTLERFTHRAWRRPITEAERAWVLEAYTEGRAAGLDWAGAVGHAMKVVLLSPDFLFRVEPDPPPGEVRDLTDHELATRLAFFLWSSAPDEALLAEADRGDLSRPDVLAWHARRMLDDPRADALIDGFAEQWLGVRALAGIQPDPELFPAFDEQLRASMGEELRRMAREHLLADRPILDLLTTQETFLDQRLAEHYGVSVPASDGEWVRTDLAGTDRGGILTTAGFLALSSHPDRTSVVRRGKLVLGALLCDEPPPPPPGVEGLEEVDPASFDSVREQLEAHRADPACAACHAEMDPIGFALQNYDAIGQVRAVDEMGAPIDPIASLPDGTVLRGPAGVAAWASGDPRWPRCVAEKVFTWGLGRVPQPVDEPALDRLVEVLTAGDGRFETLVLSLIETPAFRRKAGPEVP